MATRTSKGRKATTKPTDAAPYKAPPPEMKNTAPMTIDGLFQKPSGATIEFTAITWKEFAEKALKIAEVEAGFGRPRITTVFAEVGDDLDQYLLTDLRLDLDAGRFDDPSYPPVPKPYR